MLHISEDKAMTGSADSSVIVTHPKISITEYTLLLLNHFFKT